MNKLYIGIILLGLLSVAILMTNIVLILKFKDFKDLSELWGKIHVRQSEMHRLILEEYKEMNERYDSQRALFGTMCEQYNAITDQYERIANIQDEYRKLCKECVDRYGDAYEQFKLCNDKLNKICTPKELLKDDFFYEIAPANDDPNGGKL